MLWLGLPLVGKSDVSISEKNEYTLYYTGFGDQLLDEGPPEEDRGTARLLHDHTRKNEVRVCVYSELYHVTLDSFVCNMGSDRLPCDRILSRGLVLLSQ
jgi:hypothetical protein